jgi:ribosome biogenesis GTPase
MELTGKVIRSTRSKYVVYLENKRYTCSVRGKIAGAPDGEGFSIKVGDDVRMCKISDHEGVIEEVLPRRSKLSRAVGGRFYREHIIATNIDQMVIIMSVKKPAFKPGLLDRYLVIAEKNGLTGIICINKIDLADDNQFAEYADWYPKLGYPVYFTSALEDVGLDQFGDVLKEKVSVLVGHSGVGKSSLVQKIEPSLNLKVSEISEKRKKGKHTTSFVELFPLSFGGYLIDTPGVRELGLWDVYRDELKIYFTDFVKRSDDCQFKDCSHINEPGCAVKAAVSSGEIFFQRYRSYCQIYHDLKTMPYELNPL